MNLVDLYSDSSMLLDLQACDKQSANKEMLEYLVDQGFNVVMGVSGDLNTRRLTLGQADLWVTDGLVGPLMAEEEHGITGLQPVLVFRETPMYLAFSNNTDPAVIEDLQQALDEAREAGEIERIAASYE